MGPPTGSQDKLEGRRKEKQRIGRSEREGLSQEGDVADANYINPYLDMHHE